MLPNLDLGSKLEIAVTRAGKLAQDLRDGLESTIKPDGSIVTNADRELETLLRAELTAILPGSRVWGEEFGMDPGDGGPVWLVDPIDGTSNYNFGLPIWGVTVGLMDGPEIIAGAVCMPDLGWSFLALKGQGATLNQQPLPNLKPGPVARYELVGQADEEEGPFSKIGGKRRHFGAFVADGMFMARGGLRAMVATKAHLYDAAGSLIVLRELGAETLTASGLPFDESNWLRDVRMEPILIAAPGVWS